MFRKLRQKIEESDVIRKPSQPAADTASLDSESPSLLSAHQHQGAVAAPASATRSRQSSVGSAASETSPAVAAAGGEASPMDSLSRPELMQRLVHAQSLARRYKARLFEADQRLREGGLASKLAARDRLVRALKLQSKCLSEGRPVADELLAEIRLAEAELDAGSHGNASETDSLDQKGSNGESSQAGTDGDQEAEPADCRQLENQQQLHQIGQLEAEVKQLREMLAAKTSELEELQSQLKLLRQSDNSADQSAAAVAVLEVRLRQAEAKLTAAEQRHRDERAIAAEEAAAARRRLKQQLAELQQQLAARDREAALKDSTGATRELEIRTLKERLDSRLASEKRLREELKARGAEATSLADQLRVSRLEAENLARECREQRRQLEAGLAGELERLEAEQADKLKAAAKEFQDRLDAKERQFQATFQEAVDRFQEAESRARATHRLETDELLQSLEAHEVSEARLKRRLESAEAERDAALVELAASQSAAVEEVERLRAELAEAQAARRAAEATVEELRAQLDASGLAEGSAAAAAAGASEAIRSAAVSVSDPNSNSGNAQALNKLAHQVDQLRAAATLGRPNGDSVSVEDYEAVKMYAADLQTQLMSVNSELAELRTRAGHSKQPPQQQQQPPPHQTAPSSGSAGHPNSKKQYKSDAFTEIPEVEYLRNVLYKYMLGEKTQTLARVICTVLKFNDYQIQQVMDHEGKRAAMHAT